MNHNIKRLDDPFTKAYDLKKFYPSQIDLFEDAKYSLFESLSDSDTMKMIWVTFQKEGIHHYPDAPVAVDFLRHPHRHIFHFKVSLEVFHNDRDVEFIMFKRELESLFQLGAMHIDNQSCEMLAESLEKYLLTTYPGRRYSIEVSEDGENGCVLYSGDHFL